MSNQSEHFEEIYEEEEDLIVLQNLQSVTPMRVNALPPALLEQIRTSPAMVYEVITEEGLKVMLVCPIESDENMFAVSVQMQGLLNGDFCDNYFAVGKWLPANADYTPPGFKPFVGGFDVYEPDTD